ncbi:MAG: hypothetical protein PF484_03615 [Bacteroidales bacterium]|jgi:hypothetical protein|nr:hypothetical protein [Bacteroidales bacterium]
MATELENIHSEIVQRQEILNSTKQQLKKEFIGIDQVIDDAIDSLSSWYLFPNLQDKPVVVNLWGLTGVGKSSLVNRTSELIHFDNKYFRFDLGENDSSGSIIKRQLEEIYENENGFPILIALDEFQHARTIDEIGQEVEKSASRIIWQLLDSGKFQISKYNFHLEDIYDLAQKLRHLLKNGVKVLKGKVISKAIYFVEQMELKSVYETSNGTVNQQDIFNVLFVPTDYYEIIYSTAKEKFSNSFEVKLKLLSLNGYETIQFLLDIFSQSNCPKTVDCSKSLIFVLGNLDEAYTMSRDYNPDMDADEFHEQSLKITIPIVKNALKRRFRNEQIARLGNNHIIYPAFNQESFKKIIGLELAKITKIVYTQQKITLKFDQSIHDMIYKEGVYPTQGTRPIFTTIHQIINSKLGKVISHMILEKLNVSKMIFKALNTSVIVDYIDGQNIIHTLVIKQNLNLEKLRKNKKDDIQAITAVHETGHTIISTILLRTLPEVVFSNTAEDGNAGFVYSKLKWKYISRKEIQNRLALFLAGYVAEKIIFGEENVTTGAEGDIEKATEFASDMLKKCGMGSFLASYHTKDLMTRLYLHDETNKIDNEAEKWLKSAKELAEATLKEQEPLLIKMADYLSDNRIMTKEKIKYMIKNYARNFDLDTIIENGDRIFYRNHLKDKVFAIEKESEIQQEVDSYKLMLNKKSNSK